MNIIEVQNLSKKYHLTHENLPYDSFRDELVNLIKKPIKWLKGHQEKQEDFWALKNINFSVKKGEILGVIGRNGAGKTTLLKILSRITYPTEGEAIIRGRVSSLLEVGTGFHPELSGRENIYLNGAILGMTKKEINAKFNEIVKFAEIDKFLDTPVKRYSSGMYVRLAFAVAAHLEPEILLVDEVLAVGDYEFQQKCLKKMEKVNNAGRTVLFVSHSMASIINLCSRTILLDSGKIIKDGPTSEVVNFYLNSGQNNQSQKTWDNPDNAPGDEYVKLHSVRILSKNGKTISEADIQKDITIEMKYWNLCDNIKLLNSIHIINSQGITVLTSGNLPSASISPDNWYNKSRNKGLYVTTCRIPGNFLNEGLYFINIYIAEFSLGIITSHVAEEQIIAFNVIDTGAMRKEYTGTWVGVVRPRLNWETKYIN